MDDLLLKPVAYMKTDFETKFGLPRQAALLKAEGKIVFTEEYRKEEILRGLDSYSHLWILWGFSEFFGHAWNTTVRPPRLGGNERVGVFASRAPLRPNPIAMSLVEIVDVDTVNMEIVVRGVDMMNGTPVYDIKPYVPYADSVENALSGFSDPVGEKLNVVFECDCDLSDDKKRVLTEVLSMDPRPAYHEDGRKVYGFGYAGYEVKFRVESDTLYVSSMEKKDG